MKIKESKLNQMFERAGIQKETLYNGLIQMGTKHLKKDLKKDWHENNPTRNYCYVVTELVYQYLVKDKDASVYCLNVEGDDYKHWYIKLNDGSIVDLTAEQFEVYGKIDYSKGKKRFFQSPSPSKRTRILADLIGVKKIPYPKTDVRKLKHNITFDEIQSMEWKELADYIDLIRKEILNNWNTNNTPPSIGKTESDIIKQFSRLKDYDISKMFVVDRNYPQFNGMIKNFSKTGSACNQFFSPMLKTKIDGLSIYDWFNEASLKTQFRRKMVKLLRLDGMYSYSKCLKKNDSDDLRKWIEGTKSTSTEFWLEPTDNLEGDSVKVGIEEVEALQSEGLISNWHFRNIVDKERTLSQFHIRYYPKNQKVYPKIVQIFRLGFGQAPVNFPPLTARLIYEKFLSETKQDSYTVFDMCSGWGGRLLGALSSNLKIHYVGTDVNSNNFGLYSELAKFYNGNSGGKNTFEMFQDGCEIISENKRFQKHKGKLDLCFTSPPYFSREQYSSDKEQSCNSFPNYNDWLKGFLLPTIITCYDYLKSDKYMLINIADVKYQDKDIIPLEQDTISLAVRNGFKFEGTMGMVMSRMIGLNPKNVRNNWFDYDSRTYYKIEPILIFKKNG